MVDDMSQIFSPESNTLARLSLLGGALFTVIILGFLFIRDQSPNTRAVGTAIEQPVRFSHELHTVVVNIECAYCHGPAEVSAYAGIPDTHTCMSCHSQIATYSELLEPVRSSYDTNEPLVWNKVHVLADHVYFNHSAHVNNGYACETCHGQVDQMPLVWQAEHMTMGWCLECHREPEQFVRPDDEIYTIGYEYPEDQVDVVGPALIEEYQTTVDGLMTCGICHR